MRAAFAATITLAVVALLPGAATANGGPPLAGGGGAGNEGSHHSTSATLTHSFDSGSSGGQPALHCTVYANGAGMGSYCASLTGGGAAQTLRERFSQQAFQRCRYRKVPPAWAQRPNPDPVHGRYMVQICIDGIDWDTVSGGPGRTVDIDVVWVPWDQNVDDIDNPVNNYIWGLFSGDAQLPVPMIVTHPNTPVVGQPTYFTMRWVNPATRHVVAKGPYAGNADGGPFQEVDLPDGITMTAQGRDIEVDPNQVDMHPVRCAGDTPYNEGAAKQPAGACFINFPRSSASADQLEDPKDPMPPLVKGHESYYLAITVHWDIKYGRGRADNILGHGFDMVIHQVMPVWEVQAPNLPPQVSIH